MSIFQQLKEGGFAQKFNIDLIVRQMPFILLIEELVFRVLPFLVPNLSVAFFLSIWLSLVIHCWDRQIHRSNRAFGVFFLTIQTLIAVVLALVYLNYGFWTSYLVHLFWDFGLIAFYDLLGHLGRRKQKAAPLQAYLLDPKMLQDYRPMPEFFPTEFPQPTQKYCTECHKPFFSFKPAHLTNTDDETCNLCYPPNMRDYDS